MTDMAINPALSALRVMGLARPDEMAEAIPLTGGVSSEIYRVDLSTGPVCVKRALPKLRVAADWQAPIERGAYEAKWMRQAGAIAPGSVPALLGEAEGCLAMAYLPPDRYRLWKADLAAGHVDVAFAGQVGAVLGRLHAATASWPDLAVSFDSAAIFHAIRLEPYLLATARAHPDRADALAALVAACEANQRAVIHGDVSPKNILRGPDGPVFLDAECATWGDPAFDAAFCLNHLLLKCLWVPAARADFLAAFDAFSAAWGAGVTWEAPEAAQARVARLLPGLLLARVDGKSPVEYITTDADRSVARHVGRALLASPPTTPREVRDAWKQGLGT